MRVRIIGDGPWASVYRSLLPVPEHTAPELPDAVIVVNKAHLHHSEAIRWLRWGVPVLVEKPFAMTVAQCEEMIECAEQNNTYLAAAHVLKFDRRIEALKPLETKHVDIRWSDPCNGRYDAAVPIECDVLPHIVSIIDTLCPGSDIACEGVSFGGRGRSVRLSCGGVTFDAHLERDAAERQRIIDTGTRILNFSSLPHDHNPLRDLIEKFMRLGMPGYGLPGSLNWHARKYLSPDLALKSCRVTEDVLDKTERYRPSLEAYVGP